MGGGDGHILCHFTGPPVSSCDFMFDLLICWEIDFEIKLRVFLLSGLKATLDTLTLQQPKAQKRENKTNQRANWLNPERQEHPRNHCQNHLCSVSLWLSLFPAPLFFFFNCWIIHLRALIYPPSSALYVRPLCETLSWISNELVAYKVFLPGKAPIYGHVCLFFININPLGEERPYAIFSRTVPGTSLGGKSHCFS